MNRSILQMQRFLQERARSQPHRGVDDLMRFATDWSILQAAWRAVARSGGGRTAGMDGMTVRDAAAVPERRDLLLQDIARRMQSGRLQLGPVRRISIAKSPGSEKRRSIAILNLSDRVVHAAIKIVLEPLVEARLGKRCFGFRSGRGRYDQVKAIRRTVEAQGKQYQAAICTDIADCFDSLNHKLLRQDFRKLVTDKSLLRLLDQILEQVSLGRTGWKLRRPRGVLQGSPLSPLLANLHLTRFDLAWEKQYGEEAPAYRYADDLAVLVPSEAAGRRLQSKVKQCLRSTTGLRLSGEKTRIVTFEQGVPLLGLLLRRCHDPFEQKDRLRILLDPQKVREVLAEIGHWVDGVDADRPLGAQFVEFNQRLRGWFESFQYAYDSSQAFEAIDRRVFTTIRGSLKKLFRCSSRELQLNHFVRLETGHDSWQADGETLLVLGSLPRRRHASKASRPVLEPVNRADSGLSEPSSAMQHLDLPDHLLPADNPSNSHVRS